jgi:hypothetical protein
MAKTLDQHFKEALEEIDADAEKLGIPFTVICKKARVARSTPGRWGKTVPITIAKVVAIQKTIRRLKAQPV